MERSTISPLTVRTNIVALAAIFLLARGGFAQAAAAAANPVGVWRGTSVCLVRPSACNDEIAVYRITRVNASDSLSLDGRRVVNGQEVEMGVLRCSFATAGARITCTTPNGVWHFTVRGDSLTGELRLPDNRKSRQVNTARSGSGYRKQTVFTDSAIYRARCKEADSIPKLTVIPQKCTPRDQRLEIH